MLNHNSLETDCQLLDYSVRTFTDMKVHVKVTPQEFLMSNRKYCMCVIVVYLLPV